jgi:S1-C subfamily serine protease
VCFAAGSGSAGALPPDQLFERISPSVWSVRSLGAGEKLLASASAVAIAPGKVVTSCAILARASKVELRRGNSVYDARLEYPDVKRDLCQLDVPSLAAPPLAPRSARGLRLGQRVYVIGFSRPNEQSIGEGLVSALRDAGTEEERIQTSVPAARGLLGAGVLDEDGYLVGIVTASPKDASRNAFAVPSDWLAEIAVRGQAALAERARRAAKSGPGNAGLPAAGTSWKYGFIERLYTRKYSEFSIQVLRVDGPVVEEAVESASGQNARRAIHTGDRRIFEQSLSGNVVLMEFAPYLLAANGGKPPAEIAGADGYPTGGAGLPPWVYRVHMHDWEQVTVPAGTFQALRVEIRGERERPPSGQSFVIGDFVITAWYTPEVKRFVRLEHKVRSGSLSTRGQLVGEDVIELLSYRPPS